MMFIKKFFFTLLIALPLFSATIPTAEQTNTTVLASADDVPDYELTPGDRIKNPRTLSSVKLS